MTDLFSINVRRPPRNAREYREISDAIHVIWAPYQRQIDKVLARRIPRMIIYADGSLEHKWDAPTQAFIDRMTEEARREVNGYLQQRGIAL